MDCRNDFEMDINEFLIYLILQLKKPINLVADATAVGADTSMLSNASTSMWTAGAANSFGSSNGDLDNFLLLMF